MPRVFIPAPLRNLADGQPVVELEGHTVRALIAALDERYPGMAARLLEDGHLNRGLMISIDGTLAVRGLLSVVQPTSEVHFLPAIGGG